MVISKRNFGSLNHFGWGFITYYIPSQKILSEIFLLMNENIHKWGQKTRLRLVLLFANNWSSERIIYGCLSSLTKKLTILKFCTRGIRLIISWIEWNQTHYFQSFLFKIKKKSGSDIFYQIIAHVHFREILSGYFCFLVLIGQYLSHNWLLNTWRK
jgi:hypothetical protein